MTCSPCLEGDHASCHHDQWVFEFYGDLAIEIAEGQR